MRCFCKQFKQTGKKVCHCIIIWQWHKNCNNSLTDVSNFHCYPRNIIKQNVGTHYYNQRYSFGWVRPAFADLNDNALCIWKVESQRQSHLLSRLSNQENPDSTILFYRQVCTYKIFIKRSLFPFRGRFYGFLRIFQEHGSIWLDERPFVLGQRHTGHMHSSYLHVCDFALPRKWLNWYTRQVVLSFHFRAIKRIINHMYPTKYRQDLSPATFLAMTLKVVFFGTSISKYFAKIAKHKKNRQYFKVSGQLM